MEMRKTLALAIAAVMMFAGGFAALACADESDAAAGSAGDFNVYIYTEENDIGTWTCHNVQAYNAMLAIMGCPEYSSSTATINQTYDYPYQYQGETYYDIDATYGTITEFMGMENDTVTGSAWNMLVLTQLSDEQSPSWKLGDAATGWYKPFEDYAARMPAYGTANIALYYGDSGDSSAMASGLSAYISGGSDRDTIPLTSVIKAPGSAFEHRFFIKKVLNWMPATVASGSWATTWGHYPVPLLVEFLPLTGYGIVGYGSDAMLALIDAVGSANVVFEDTAIPAPGYETYGWMNTLFGLDMYYDANANEWIYWQIYTEHTTLQDSNNVSAPLLLGAYSALTNAPKTDGSFTLMFQAYTP